MIRAKCPKCGDDGVLLCGDCMFAEMGAPPVISAHLAALLGGALDHVPDCDPGTRQGDKNVHQ